MKKLFTLLLMIFSALLISYNVYASSVTYANVVSDNTTIEDDFELLGMEVSDYYLTKYDYQKWYVVAIAEAYTTDNDIQTYFYLYNPTVYDEDFPILTISYKINGKSGTLTIYSYLAADLTRSLYKIKGFEYNYSKESIIKISNIHSYLLLGEDPYDSGYDLVEEYDSASSFTATNSHSLASEAITTELNFNSTLIIDEYNVVRVSINQDDNFINNWNTFWNGKEVSLDIYFYNFNFPDRIEYDSVEYAKFQYDYLTYYEVIYDLLPGYATDEIHLLNTEHVVSEYKNDSKTLRVNDSSQEMTFPTFYLGNRFNDSQFNLKDKVILDGNTSYFDCDCSILLDSTYRDTTIVTGSLMGQGINVGHSLNYTVLDQIELLELHYKNDGILYKCQVVDEPVDDDDIKDIIIGNEDKSLWEQFLEWFTTNFPQSVLYTLGGIILVITLGGAALALILKLIIAIITWPFKKILNL